MRVPSAIRASGKPQVIFIDVEFACGLPAWNMTGFHKTSPTDMRSRVKKAFAVAGIDFPLRHISVRADAPVDCEDESPLALAVAAGIYMLNLRIDSHMPFVIGNISEAGAVIPVGDCHAFLKVAAQHGFKRAVVPDGNMSEERTTGLETIGVNSLQQLDDIGASFFRG